MWDDVVLRALRTAQGEVWGELEALRAERSRRRDSGGLTIGEARRSNQLQYLEEKIRDAHERVLELQREGRQG